MTQNEHPSEYEKKVEEITIYAQTYDNPPLEPTDEQTLRADAEKSLTIENKTIVENNAETENPEIKNPKIPKPQRSQPGRNSVNSFADIHSLFSNSSPTAEADSGSDPTTAETPNHHVEYTELYKNTYDITSAMMYLVGVKKEIFEMHVPNIMPVYETLQKNNAARIIRNLCMVRTSLFQNYNDISYQFRFELKNLGSTPDYIPSDAVHELEAENIILQKSRPDIYQYVTAINLEISNRINNVKAVFPEWLNWGYVRQVFLMPNGLRVEGVKSERKQYSSRMNDFPYQCYINWHQEINGNLFNHDYKFVNALYELHGEHFENVSLVRDAGDILMGNLYDFINAHGKIVIVVDCENSNPVKLAAALSSLTAAQRQEIHKVMLFDSNHTTAAWTTLCNTGITREFTMERVIVERLYEHKSQVDMTLAASTCREIYVNGADAVILISSDSDYWALIKALPETDFLVMLEREKSGRVIKDALDSQGIVHCYIDDFCTASSHAIITKTIINTLQQQFDEMVHFNARKMLDDVLQSTWLTLSDREKEIFYDRYLKRMRLDVDSDGNARLVMGA